ncbi:MAG: glycosyltransferase, partial [Terriglobia bacterium]
MTVVVNAVAAKMGGAATYLRALVRELAAAPEAGRFVVYVPPEQAELGRGAPPHIEWRVSAAGHAGALRRFWWDQVTLRRLVRRERADVLYSTANFALLFCPVPQVLLVRQALYFSPLYASVVLRRKSRRFRLAHWLRRQLVQLSIRHATTVLAPSRSLQDQMRAAGASWRARVEVLPYGAQAFNHSRANPGTAPKHERPLRLLLADLYAEHKNLGTVLDAMNRVRERNGLAVQLTTTADP